MFPPADFTRCNSAHNTEFAENCAAPGGAALDPKRLAEMTAHNVRRPGRNATGPPARVARTQAIKSSADQAKLC